MPEIAVTLDAEENRKVEIYKARHGLVSKAVAIADIIKKAKIE
jgi:hypothetical protein